MQEIKYGPSFKTVCLAMLNL